ncbi:extracellular solute-binding protein [Paenibacillus nasutitermitis]|uniref:ABC transporter substrate-binding protein n=1 Tax=Paenibacillus nasutitermitis TaxID=1652958 RepID=A0A916ZDU2_9BACL|nr:extracellular solute-binding protein [Paenibacillus nasutitermitis]GGD89253.1 ABC transporter substrate-binding protein [Paenibacillus nasutitermitis]
MKKTMTLLISLMLVFSLVAAACSKDKGGTAASTGNGGKKAAAEGEGNTGQSEAPVKISIFAQQNADTDLKTNSFTKEAEKMFNIQFDWQTIPYDGAAEKRQISLASGDYPDLYMLIPWVDRFSQTDLLRFSQQGVVLPLNDLIDKYAPNIKAALDQYPYYKAMNTAPDGYIYGLSQLVECYHCSYPNKMWLNTKWLDKLDLKMPTTTDEFKAVLKAFKTKDPNGNGKADEVPLSGSTEDYGVHIIPYFMNGFIYDDDRTYLMLDGDKVDIAANKPEWKEGLDFVKSLYDEGLIDPGAFTQNAEAYKKIGDNAETQILGAGVGMHPAIFVSTGDDTPYGADYNPVAPLQGPKASYATYNYPSDPGASFVLTNKASEEAQIAAIKLVDYMMTPEGNLRANFGEEGLDWRKPAEGEKAINDATAPFFTTIQMKKDEKPHNSSWGAMAQYYNPKEYRDSWVAADDIYSSAGYERRLQQATELYDGKQPENVFPHWAIWVDPATADEAAMMKTNIKDYIDQNALQFVTGAKDLNKDWDAYVKGLDNLNLKRYLEIMQAAYDGTKGDD